MSNVFEMGLSLPCLCSNNLKLGHSDVLNLKQTQRYDVVSATLILFTEVHKSGTAKYFIGSKESIFDWIDIGV